MKLFGPTWLFPTPAALGERSGGPWLATRGGYRTDLSEQCLRAPEQEPFTHRW